MNISRVFGLDVGHSAVKAAFVKTPPGGYGNGLITNLIFPSVVAPAITISDDVEARRAEAETVEVHGRKFFVGETALIQGGAQVSRGLSEDWIDTPEHSALILGAIKKARAMGCADFEMLVLGLPSNLYARQREGLRNIASDLLPGVEVKVIPQPMGAYQFDMFNEHGQLHAGRKMAAESWGVVEIGHFSTDFLLMLNGRFVEKASGSCSGARVVAEQLQRIVASQLGITATLEECEEALATRCITIFGKTTDVSVQVGIAVEQLITEVVDNAKRILEQHARRLNGIIVAGGGAPLCREALADLWPHTRMAASPRLAVSEGMRRFGLGLLNAREMAKKTAVVGAK